MKKTTPPAPPEKAPAPSREIEILREGRFTALDGQAVSFTAADLDELVSSYDADSDPAPIVIGHPKTDAPAWGWAKSLRVDGNILKATVDQLEPAFAEAVAAGRYKRVSASLYPRGQARANSNKPGQTTALYRLWGAHIALLYKAPVPDSEGAVTFAGTFQWGDQIAGQMPDADIGLRGGVKVRSGESVKERVIANQAGYFLQNVVA